VGIEGNGGIDFRQLGAKFRAAGKDGAAVRKVLTKTIRAKLARIVAEQKREALNMQVKGTRGKGAARREQFHTHRAKRARRGGYGLRNAVSRGIVSKVTYSGYKVGARISVSSAQLPQSQRRLPRRLNSRRGWRHPVWGNRDRWVQQHGEPYFDNPINRHRDEVRREVYAAVNEVMRTLQ